MFMKPDSEIKYHLWLPREEMGMPWNFKCDADGMITVHELRDSEEYRFSEARTGAS